MANAISKNISAFALGITIFFKLGIAIQEALAANIASMNLFPTSFVTSSRAKATLHFKTSWSQI